MYKPMYIDVEGKVMREFVTGATRDNDDTKLDYEGFLSPHVLRVYATYMHKNRKQADGQLRASDNWQKGIPQDVYMKSMFRHFMEVWENHRYGTVSTDSLCALLFNVQGYLYERLVDANNGSRPQISGDGGRDS